MHKNQRILDTGRAKQWKDTIRKRENTLEGQGRRKIQEERRQDNM